MNQLGDIEVCMELVGDAMEETGLFNPHANPFFFGAVENGHSILSDFQSGGQVVTAPVNQKP